jgi:hypothetical protein
MNQRRRRIVVWATDATDPRGAAGPASGELPESWKEFFRERLGQAGGLSKEREKRLAQRRDPP